LVHIILSTEMVRADLTLT